MKTIRIKRVVKDTNNLIVKDGYDFKVNDVWYTVTRDMTKPGKPLGVFTQPSDLFIPLTSLNDLHCDIRVCEEFEVLYKWTDPATLCEIAIIKTQWSVVSVDQAQIAYRIVKRGGMFGVDKDDALGWEDVEEPACYLLKAVEHMVPVVGAFDEFRTWIKSKGY